MPPQIAMTPPGSGTPGHAPAKPRSRVPHESATPRKATRDFGSLAALISTADRDAVRRFLAAQVGPVIEHDRDHKMSLLATLKAFVEHEGRYQAAADALGIHVTTLRYRLQRLGDLLDIDLSDRAKRFDMLLAMKLHELIDATE